MLKALAAFAVLLSAAVPAVAAPDDLASATVVIDRVNADWLPAMQAKDGPRIAAAYAPDGVFILPNGEALAGRAAVADFYDKRLATPGVKILDGAIHREGLARAADGLVYEWGRGESTVQTAAGQTVKSGGPYLTVWKRDAAGRWQILRNLAF
jgi:uncharacterized protein (TIGR02246 family)